MKCIKKASQVLSFYILHKNNTSTDYKLDENLGAGRGGQMSPIRSFHRGMEIDGKNEKKRRKQGSFGRKRSEKSRKFDEFAGNSEQADGRHAGSDYGERN